MDNCCAFLWKKVAPITTTLSQFEWRRGKGEDAKERGGECLGQKGVSLATSEVGEWSVSESSRAAVGWEVSPIATERTAQGQLLRLEEKIVQRRESLVCDGGVASSLHARK